jgi:hypothetical protein
MLLSNGADPSTTFPFHGPGLQTSCWSQFLEQVWCEGYQGRRLLELQCTTVDLGELMESFLSNSANLHEKVGFRLTKSLHSPPPAWVWSDYIPQNLLYELSVRYMLTELLRHNPRFSEIEKRLEKAGAQATRRVLLAHDADYGAGVLFLPISEQDSQYLQDTIDEYEALQSTDDESETVQPTDGECETLQSPNAAIMLDRRVDEVRQRDPCTENCCLFYCRDPSTEPDSDGVLVKN